MLLVQLGINSSRDVWKFCQIGLARPILATFLNITCTILIPKCTRHRMILPKIHAISWSPDFYQILPIFQNIQEIL
jgi:hypothetical protein